MKQIPLSKLFAAIILVTFLSVQSPFSLVQAAKTDRVPIEVYAKGSSLSFSLSPFLLNHTAMAPVRPIAEALDAKISWNKQTKTVTLTEAHQKLTFQVGSSIAYLNGKAVKLDSQIELADDNAIVPVRFLAEALKRKVEWMPGTHSVHILDKNQISISAAEKLVRQKLSLSPSSLVNVQFDHAEEDGRVYVIHVYKEIQTAEQAHTATIGWYYVHSLTGKVESMF